ncbi:MAG: metallophosphoesterase [Planctomycetaceae bacterium]|jgi:3',5'-cyclic AMP phosphodiesterase CpdA|nr:metallophosphoesterase [Planctomycetaceae bacterium]
MQNRREFLKNTAMLGMAAALPMNPVFGREMKQQKEWSFGVIPDTQWKTNMEAPFHGTAIHVIDAINAEMIRQKVDFVLEVGDLVEEASAIAFQTRAQHNKVLEDAEIEFYPLRGNHDSRNRINHVNCGAAVAQYKSAFPNLPGTPGNGGSSPDLPNAVGMTYSFTHKNGKFLLLDTFSLVDDGSEDGKAYGMADYQDWIDEQLKMDDHQFAMVFAHKDLLGQDHKDNVFSDNKVDQNIPVDVQNAFFASLQNNGVKYFICGHDHMYHHSHVKSPDGKSGVQQIICGSAAHKFYTPKAPFLERETPIAQELNRIGFLIIRVSENGIKTDYYSTEPFGDVPHSPTWTLRDRYGYFFNGDEFGKPEDSLRQFVRPAE